MLITCRKLCIVCPSGFTEKCGVIAKLTPRCEIKFTYKQTKSITRSRLPKQVIHQQMFIVKVSFVTVHNIHWFTRIYILNYIDNLINNSNIIYSYGYSCEQEFYYLKHVLFLGADDGLRGKNVVYALAFHGLIQC